MTIDEQILWRHQRIALSFSGGKDSLACVYLLRPYMDRIRIYHLDTGDLLPETHAVVDHVRAFWPNFCTIKGDIEKWVAENGMPTDLLPFSNHYFGRASGLEKERLVPRYDCCWINVMEPLFRQMTSEGNTLIIRGTKRADMPRLPAPSGTTHGALELYFPLADWSHEQVLAYLREVGAPVSRVYDHVLNGPDCARCTAWWPEQRAAYLKQHHPDIFRDYVARLRRVREAIAEPLAEIDRELAEASA